MLLLLALAFLLAATEPDLVGEFSFKGEDVQQQAGVGRCVFSASGPKPCAASSSRTAERAFFEMARRAACMW